MNVRLVVLNYNGAEILGETVPTLLEACSRSRHDCRLSMIDNGSTDGSAALMKRRFPDVEILPMPNRILCSYNDVVARMADDVVILLNNDLKTHLEFIDPLVMPFEKEADVFLVAPKVFDYDGKSVTGGLSRIWMSAGIVKSALSDQASSFGGRALTFAAGSAGAYDRKKFVELGGYDALYLPGTVEDMDLCYRAWEKGYKCLYEPESHVYHRGQTSFHKRFGARGTAAINARNIYLFMWKNFDSPRLWVEHIAFLPARFVWAIARNQSYWVGGFFKALARIREVASRRRERKAQRPLRSDVQILSLFKERAS